MDDRETKARAIAAAAAATRPRTARGIWIAAAIASVVCVGALAIAWVQSSDEPSHASSLAVREPTTRSSGFGVGLMVGVGIGLAIASAVALRRRGP